MDTATLIDRAILAAIAVVLVVSIGVHLWDSDYFTLVYAFEDGPVEWGTAVFLFISSLVMAANARSLFGKGLRGAAILTVVYGLLFFLAAGEEISWGQRIFGWESGEFFVENNKQAETNLHNLIVGGVHLTKVVFGPVLTAVILLYLVALPLLYSRVGWVRRLADRFVVPVPGMRHLWFALISSIIIGVMDQSRRWEVYELIFSLIMLSIFLWPQNRDKTR